MGIGQRGKAIRGVIRDLADAVNAAEPGTPKRERLHESLDKAVLATIERDKRPATGRVTRRERTVYGVIHDLSEQMNAAEPGSPEQTRWLASLDTAVVAMIERDNRPARVSDDRLEFVLLVAATVMVITIAVAVFFL